MDLGEPFYWNLIINLLIDCVVVFDARLKKSIFI